MDQVAQRAFAALALGASLVVVAAVARAQDVATIAGRVVHKQSKAGIPSADVRLSPGNRSAVTDSAGHFRFDRVPPGSVSVLVRRLGFAPESTSFAVRAADDLEILVELQEAAQPLDTVAVTGKKTEIPRGKLAGYFERKRSGIGRFLDGDVLENERHRQLGDLITSRTPGSRLVRSRLGSGAWIATTRQPGTSLVRGSSLDESDRLRGADPGACYPDVYVDGTLVYAFGYARPLFDINSIGTANVAAVELYVGPSRIPAQYNKASAVCGVLLIWTW